MPGRASLPKTRTHVSGRVGEGCSGSVASVSGFWSQLRRSSPSHRAGIRASEPSTRACVRALAPERTRTWARAGVGTRIMREGPERGYTAGGPAVLGRTLRRRSLRARVRAYTGACRCECARRRVERT